MPNSGSASCGQSSIYQVPPPPPPPTNHTSVSLSHAGCCTASKADGPAAPAEDASAEEAELWLDGLTFTVTPDPDSCPCYFGERASHELLPGGSERAVTL
eukprot:COSAG01_NODE_25055_length_757_cov_0.772036_2_plen_99_part_01